MKILFLSGASSIHTVRWVNTLAERNHEVVLVSQKNHQEGKNIIQKKVKVIYLPIAGIKGYYLNAYALRKIYAKETFDAVNVHYASGYGTLARIAKLPEIILNVWGSDVYDFPYESGIKEFILRKNLAYAAQLVSTSHSMKKQTEKFLNSKKGIEVIPFGVDTEKFKPEEGKSKRRNFVFGTVKTLSSKYGIDTIIEAFMIFLKKIPADKRKLAQLKIYGTGELEEKLKKIVQAKNLGHQIYFGGYIENTRVPDALREMDVFLLGSRMQSESFGVAAVEAMACGLPVIATRVSGFKEVMEDEKTGFLVPVDDATGMAEKMLTLYKDTELREEMGANGRNRVELLYNWKENVNKMEENYFKIKRLKEK